MGRLIATVLVIVLTCQSCAPVSERGPSICGRTPPADYYYGFFRRFPRPPPGEAWYRPHVETGAITERYDAQALECYAREGDPLAVFVIADNLHSVGRDIEAIQFLERNLPARAVSEWPAATVQACQSPRDVHFYRCSAGLADSWLLLGNLTFARLGEGDNAEVSHRAYANAAALGFRDAIGRVRDIERQGLSE